MYTSDLDAHRSPHRICVKQVNNWVIPRIVRSISVRSTWAGLVAQKGTPSAPQPMSSACQHFPIISYEIPLKEKVLRRPNIVAVTEEGAELSPNARSANARFKIGGIRTMWQIGVLTGKPCTFLASNGSFSVFWHYNNKERVSRGLDLKWRIPLLVVMPPNCGFLCWNL